MYWIPLLSLAQVTISGRVQDADTEEPIPFCNVYIQGTTIGVSTDLEGNYSITTDRIGDSLVASAVGYDLGLKVVGTDFAQTIDFKLTSTTLGLDEVVVYAGENPAHRILKSIVKNKPNNRIDELDTYQCEKYAKVELDLENIPPEWRERKLFKPFDFVFENIDSTSDDKPFLPIYLHESLAEIYYSKGKGQPKEIVKAQQISINQMNKSFTEFIKQTESEYNIYDNWIYVLEKAFAGPLSKSGLLFYEYYLIDSAFVNGQWSYQLKFKPKRKQETTFYGDFWVADSSFAIQRINMRMSPDVNINLVKRVIIFQEFEIENDRWLPSKEKTIIDFKQNEESLGIIARVTNSYKNYQVNNPEIKEFYEKVETNYDYEEVYKEDKEFWEAARHEPLSESEETTYTMIDSIGNVPVYKTYVDVLYLLFAGYKDLGQVEIGPYSSIWSFNQVEGNRFRLGINTTADFSKRYFLGGYLAYGTQDQRFKYNINGKWTLDRNPRTQIGIGYKRDISWNSENSEAFEEGDVFSGGFRRNIIQKLIDVEEAKIYYERFWGDSGFSNKFTLLHRKLDPYGGIAENGNGFNYGYLPNLEIPTQVDTTIATTEFLFKTRYALGERYLDGNFNRVSLGSDNPIIELQYTLGFQGLGGNYTYHKVALSYEHWQYFNPFGWLSYKIRAGKTFGTVPFLLLDVHPGNESWFHSFNAFNTMNNYEFASEAYASIYLTHHFEGFFLNKIPLIRKLNLREVASFKAVIGTIGDENLAANALNEFQITDEDTYTGFRTPNVEPYMEAGIGIENILKIFRIEAVWRLNYLDNPQAKRFNLRAGVNFYF